MTYSIVHSESQEDWASWDDFLNKSSRGIYLQTEDWLKSYSSYGFSSSLILAKTEGGEILGGIGAVLAKTGPFKVLVCPYGPIIKEGQEHLIEELVDEFLKVGKRQGAFLVQLSTPFSSNPISPHTYSFVKDYPGRRVPSGRGIPFKFVIGVSAFRAVHLFPKEADAYEKIRKNYKASTRRDVNKSQRMGNELQFANSLDDIKAAYSLIELNAVNQGYSVRSWSEFGSTLVSLVNKGLCHIVTCVNEGELKGALVIFDVGNKLHYIMGATLREKKDLMVGHFLQDQVIQFGVSKGYDFYDISMGGSEGVVRFKKGFGGEELGLEEPYYWVLKPWLFWTYQKLMPWVQRNKKFISRLLSKK
ncbi:lipid II:glycine glycyltransferase FemX [Algoriphagus sediminis]|uniref:GNAT family N-acetyltransferase n=1 Tax=Algoriphagus sediminis TaxID=3057113 RepID=A0ABT7YBL1_9BACT|nr:GNAT family N-acetyltransferase [Algoriphagus sediminis]MDN3203904.1 GNAT family N-acetyltransferase [Algoriphagus sediminis]